MVANVKDIKEPVIRSIIIQYLKERKISITKTGKVYVEWSCKLIKAFKNIGIEELNWYTICHCGNSNDISLITYSFGLMYYMIDKDIFCDPKNIDSILERRKDFENLESSVFKKSRLNLGSADNLTPYSIITLPKRKKSQFAFYIIPNCDEKLYRFIHSFVEKGVAKYSRVDFSFLESMFAEYTGDGYLTNFSDYTDDIFKKQLDKLLKLEKVSDIRNLKTTSHVIEGFIKFYLWIMESMNDAELDKNFKIFTYDILCYPYFIKKYLEGYKIVVLNPYTDIPKEDKLMLRQTNEIVSSKDIGAPCCIDFTVVNNLHQRELAKKYYWLNETKGSFKSLNKTMLRIFELINICDGVYSKETIIKYITSEYYKNSCGTISRNWLSYVNSIEPIKDYEVIMNFLVNRKNESNAYLEAYTLEEVKLLLEAYKKDSTNDSNKSGNSNMLCYFLLQFLINTPMRLQSLLALTTDSLIQLGDSDMYVIRVRDKTSPIDGHEYNATKKDALLFKQILAYTEQFRKNCTKNYNNYLFICEQSHMGAIGRIKDRYIEKHHIRICEEYGIRYLPFASASRNTYMQAITKYGEDNNFHKLEISNLTGHGLDVNENNYMKRQISDISEKLFNVQIGNIELNGGVLRTSDPPKKNIVLDKTGFCVQDNCRNGSNIGCLNCPHYRTSIENIPFHELRIKKLDELIYEQDNSHEKEFLVTFKTYHVAYLNKLYELKDVN